MLTFSRLIARRYFALGKRRGWRAYIPSLILALLLALDAAFTAWLWHAHSPAVQAFRIDFGQYFLVARLVLIVALVLALFFTVLVTRLTIFTTISVYGLFLGSGALVIVLSVMSGFEHDLKRKILGTNAHIVVTRPDHPFTDYVDLRNQLAHIPGVLGATPYLTNEVMMASSTNLAGVVVKGIDPATVGEVTDLVRNTDVGGIDYLVHADKLASVGGPPLLDEVPQEPKGEAGKRGGEQRQADDGPQDGAQGERSPEAKVESGRALQAKGERVEPAKGERVEQAKDQRKRRAKAQGEGLSPDQREDGQRRHAKAQGEQGAPGGAAVEPRRVVPGVIIGRELAKTLRLYLGDDVDIVSPFGGIGPSGPIPKSKPFRTAGIFFSGMFEYDSKYAYITLPAAQKFFGMRGEVTGLELKVKNPDETEPVVAAVQKIVGKSYDVRDWKQINRSLFSALKIEKILMFVLLCFIILVAAFSIIANGTMLVMEKGREVAILKSMGASDGSILATFLLLGLLMGGLGTVTGISVGVIGCLALMRFGIPLNSDVYYITTLPVKMNPYEIVAVFFAALAIALLATLYPAWMAARLRPVEGLRDAQG